MSKNNELSTLAKIYFDWIEEESNYFWNKIIEVLKLNKRFLSADYGHQYYTEIVDTEKELDESVDNPSKRLTITECVDLLNAFALTVDKLDEDNTCYMVENLTLKKENEQLKEENEKLQKQNEDLKFALRAEQALNRVHNDSQPFRI